MTRHKQQLLQEQEMLLEQVQKNQEDNSESKETDENHEPKQFSDFISSTSPTSNSAMLASPNRFSSQQAPHPLSVETSPLDSRAAGTYPRSCQLLKLYQDTPSSRKNFSQTNLLRAGSKRSEKYTGKGNLESGAARELDNYLFGRRNNVSDLLIDWLFAWHILFQ